MGLTSKLKSVLRKEKEIAETDLDGTKDEPTIPLYKLESPDRVVETRIKPVKMPSIVDVGGKLGIMSRDLEEIKRDMVSKSWLRAEYDDSSEIIERLERIEEEINNLNNLTKGLNDHLSDDLKLSKIKLNDRILKKPRPINIPNKLFEIISKKKKLTYSEIKNEIKISDPTLSKYLKKLINENKIKREKIGRHVYYFFN